MCVRVCVCVYVCHWEVELVVREGEQDCMVLSYTTTYWVCPGGTLDRGPPAIIFTTLLPLVTLKSACALLSSTPHFVSPSVHRS
jgi:hypothetical protein